MTLEFESYVVINDPSQPEERRNVLRQKAKEISFPLSEEDSEIATLLETTFDEEENCAGLAAPQIGFQKRIIVFSCPGDPRIRKFRKDLQQTMDKTVWFNPSYEGVGDALTEDVEACFSVHNIAGPVKRFTKVRYNAQLKDGRSISGEAEGFLARIIQHEIDHLNGILCIDKMPEDQKITVEKLKADRQKLLDEDV